MAGPPQYLSLEEHRDADHLVERAARWIFMALLTAIALAALAGVFGQTNTRSAAAGGGATLEVDAPDRLRGGLFYQGRFTIRAEDEIEAATLVFDRGWTEQMHINTIEPQPVGEASRNGRLALDFGRVPTGDRLVVYLQFQVNPTNIGSRSQDVELHDGQELLARADRRVRIFP